MKLMPVALFVHIVAPLLVAERQGQRMLASGPVPVPGVLAHLRMEQRVVLGVLQETQRLLDLQ